jgi:hypothetical protein
MTVKFKLNNSRVPNGTVLQFGISYQREDADPDATRGMTPPKVYTFAMLKAGGLWYVTGSGKVPVAAGWSAVERWLEKDGKVVEWVKAATEWRDVYPAPPLPEPVDPRDEMSPGSVGSSND